MFTETARIIADRIHAAAVDFQREEDVRVRCESIFIEEMNKIEIPYNPSYEAQVSSGAIDALFNCLCIEYKTTGKLSKHPSFPIPSREENLGLHLFESSIDLLSFCTLELLSDKDWRQRL